MGEGLSTIMFMNQDYTNKDFVVSLIQSKRRTDAGIAKRAIYVWKIQSVLNNYYTVAKKQRRLYVHSMEEIDEHVRAIQAGTATDSGLTPFDVKLWEFGLPFPGTVDFEED